MTSKRVDEAKESFAKLRTMLKEAGHPEIMMERFHQSICCFDGVPDEEYWVEVDGVICVQIFRAQDPMHGPWSINPIIEIVDPETGDCSSANYNIYEL